MKTKRIIDGAGRTAIAAVAAVVLLTAAAGASAQKLVTGAHARGGPATPVPVATFVPCDSSLGSTTRCGTVAVPLDRANPGAGTIPIYFELYPRSDSTLPSLGTIVPATGGPGNSNTARRWRLLSLFGPLLDRRDLLLIDYRGIGQSAAIDCPALQHFTGDLASAVRACGAQLGAASGRYGSGDVADDVDAVRAALGIDKIDYYGVSYGAVDVRAYAYRYPDHLQSAVLDSPWLTEDWTFQASNARFYARVQATVCSRSASCSGANPDPEHVLAWLAQQLRRHPLDGIGYDADGTPHMLHVDESTIFDILSADNFGDPAFLNQGELTAAAQAFRHGDAVPLLRLAAESPESTDSGDPAGFSSAGAAVATYCADGRFVFDQNAAEPARRAQLNAAFAALPKDAFAPFSGAAWWAANDRVPLGLFGGFAPDECVAWPAPAHPDPPYPAYQRFPKTVPTLVLGSDLDAVSLDETKALLPLFPQHQFVEIANAGHVSSLLWSSCAADIVRHFITTHATGDTSCAGDPKTPFHTPFDPPTNFVPYYGVGSFPLETDAAVPARVDPAGINRTDRQERQVASVAWSTIADGFMRAQRMYGTNGRGLRGGSYTVTTSDTTVAIDYQAVRFSNDVTVTGHATRDLATNTIDAQVTVAQAEGKGGKQHGRGDPLQGTLTIHGVLYTPGEPDGQVRGTINDHQVALLVPMN
ncbi:MAG TPA: alpha/beta hydrolase [Gaiellaceae bacterium]|nr:alpha/beta hydrolase [Gaiellaceae bacterium]